MRYVSDQTSGIVRKRTRRGFAYFYKQRRLSGPRELARISKLAIPPAWENVWICASPAGHLQATGRDARGRKQYRYHRAWQAVRDQAKYHDIAAFAAALPRLRARLARDLRQAGLSKTKVLATVVELMQRTGMRIGNDRYARLNASYGLTTLLDRHARISGADLMLHFRGKSGKIQRIRMNDRRLAAIVERCRDIPGQRLFQYYEERGRHRSVSSTDVNEYVKAAMRGPFTAKEFRTWRGTVLAALLLMEHPLCASEAASKRALQDALVAVSEQLGNTVAICRKCYVHPDVIAAHLRGDLKPALSSALRRARRDARGALTREESAVLSWLASARRLRSRAPIAA